MNQQKKWRDARKHQKKKYKYPEVRMTNEVHALFTAQAETEKTGVSTVIGNMALAYLQSQQPPNAHDLREIKKIKDELVSLSLLMRNIANNVNQIAHHSNTIGGLVDEHGLLQHLKKLDESVKHTVNQLLPTTKP
jgi:ribonuclease D